MKTPQCEFYQDKAEQHRWRLKHGNSKILAASSEGFLSKSNAKRNFKAVRDAMSRALFVLAMLCGVNAMAQDTNAPSSNSLWDGLSITNITVVAYGTHFDNNKLWGGGGLLLYKFNGYVSAGLGTDWAGQWRMFNGTVTIHKDWQLNAKLSLRTYGLVAAGTSVSGASGDNGTLASGEGGGAHFTYQFTDKFSLGTGGGYVMRQNCGNFSGGSEIVTFGLGYRF